jgi:hypothetical protein
MLMYKEIENRFKRESGAYKKIRESAMREVVRWEYYPERVWNLRPGDEVSMKPVAKRDADYAYGYDAAGRVVVIQYNIKIFGKKRPDEEFLRYSKNKIEVSDFRDGSLRGVETGTLKNGQVVRVSSVGSDSSSVEDYEWEGDRPTRMLRHWNNEKSAIEFINDKLKGWEARFRVKPDGTRRPLDLPKGVTVKSLAEKIRKHLVKGVHAMVSKARIKEPIYCVVLGYSGEGNAVFPPSIGIGLESERQKLLKKLGSEAKHVIWNPEEFFHHGKPHTEINDEDYQEACEWYSEAISDRSSDAAALKLINEIAAELAKLKWSHVARVTDDFIVFAVDLEGGDLEKNMKKTVAAPVLQKFKSGGLL